MGPDERLEKFFQYWSEKCNKGEVSPLENNEVRILQIYRDWEKLNEDIQKLFGSTKRD